ncbi:hypothetical protein ACFPL7_06405 [Dongia soli]|uniref:Uncharacterized protein n=1 Tax=Dongia soli TaxID=600628 RepID=A0ABU5EAL1_9PROT|nr:hypothetical protein [Dongia soli]MDY0882573.1 hypothetical protein [Dongia soli]
MTTETGLPCIAAWHFRGAAIYAVIAMIWGIWMGIIGDHSLFPAHAHLAVVGWVSISIYGLFLARFPVQGQSRLAVIQGVIAHLGLVIFVPGIALAIMPLPLGVPLAVIGSLLLALSALLFAVLVWQATARR